MAPGTRSPGLRRGWLAVQTAGGACSGFGSAVRGKRRGGDTEATSYEDQRGSNLSERDCDGRLSNQYLQMKAIRKTMLGVLFCYRSLKESPEGTGGGQERNVKIRTNVAQE